MREDLLQVVIVVSLWRGEEWEVVATVSNSSGEEGQTEPEGCCGDMRPHDERP